MSPPKVTVGAPYPEATLLMMHDPAFLAAARANAAQAGGHFSVRPIYRTTAGGEEKIGELTSVRRGSTLHIEYVEAYKGANSLGTRAMRQVAVQLREEGVETVTGYRVSGVRSSARADVSVSLTGKPNVIGGRVVGEKTGGHWVTINGNHVLLPD